MTKKYFGTDGIRGRVGQAPITPDFMLRLGYAIGQILGSSKDATVVIGKDTRVSGYLIETALQAGLIASGVNVVLTGPIPTPAIAYLTRQQHACAGIVISASHNPYYDNGIKLFSSTGSKLDDELEHAIEAAVDLPMVTVDSAKLGKVKRLEQAAELYVDYCEQQLKNKLDLSKLRCVIDCANGATYQVAPLLFKRLGLDVISIHNEPDGYNINEQCGSTKPKSLQAAVLEHKADFGIAFDGDGDRVMFVDELGAVVDGDQLLYILAMHQQQTKGCAGVVGTLMTNLGLELALSDMGIEFTRTKVGDRYVLAECKKRGWTLGGESSGHIITLDHTTTGDGMIAALQVLVALAHLQRKLSDIVAKMNKCPQILVNVPVLAKSDPISHPRVQEAIRAIETSLNGEGRVLLRRSGTEHLIRVMVEGQNLQQVDQFAHSLASTVEDVAHK